MTLRNGQWANRPDPMYDHSHEYPNSNVLREGPNTSETPSNLYESPWFIAAEVLVIVLAIVVLVVF